LFGLSWSIRPDRAVGVQFGMTALLLARPGPAAKHKPHGVAIQQEGLTAVPAIRPLTCTS
jgi:hypothetical protein